MAGYADELRKMGKLKRNKKNFETIQAEVESLKEHAESASEIFSALEELRTVTERLENALDQAGDDNPLVANWSGDVRDAMTYLLQHLPGEDEDDDPGEIIDEVAEACEEYESSLENRDLSADDREEIWGSILDGLENVANAI